MRLRPFFALVILLIFCASIGTAQKRQLTLEDAVLYYQKGLSAERPSGFQWVKDALIYTTLEEERSTLQFHDLRPGGQDFSLKAREIMSGMERIPRISWIDATHFYFSKDHTYYLFDTGAKKLDKILEYPAEAQNLTYSIAGKKLAYTIKNNVYIATAQNPKIPVAEVQDSNIVSGQAIARYEFGITNGLFWSPSGDKLAFYRKDESAVFNYPLVDVTTYPATVNYIKYPMNGQGSEVASTIIYSTLTGKYTRLKTKKDNHYLTNFAWSPNEKAVYLAELNRDQNHMHLNKYNPKSGKFLRTITEEQNERWVEPETPPIMFKKLKRKMFWLSEKDGFMNIYVFDEKKKKSSQLTKNKWVINSILGYNAKINSIIFTGTGPNPLNTHTFAVNVKTGKQIQITKGDGVHSTSLGGTNNRYVLDEMSSPTIPRKISYYDLIKGENHEIYTAKNPFDGVQLGTTEIIKLKSYDGSDLYARMIKPSDFDPNKKYPVLVYVYGGPHAQMITNRWNYGEPLWMKWMAEQDYIIFTVDGHGSAARGFAFESEVFRQLGTHEMADQLIGVDYLKRQKFVDSNRLAVHGWSFGGFMTTSLMLRHPGVFTTGVAGGPVIDWKWYEVMYGERYMDTEATNPEGFATASLLNHVKNLKGHLLTIHGTVDDVVVPQNNYAFLKKCVDEGVQVDFFPYPMHPHNVRGKDRVHLMRKVLDYVIEHNK